MVGVTKIQTLFRKAIKWYLYIPELWTFGLVFTWCNTAKVEELIIMQKNLEDLLVEVPLTMKLPQCNWGGGITGMWDRWDP